MKTESDVVSTKGITGSTLKIIAIVAMLIDHIGAVVLESRLMDLGMGQALESWEAWQEFLTQYGTLYYFDEALRLIGRLGFPIFCFLLIEGFVHTRSRMKYGRNLLIFALVSEIPFNLAFAKSLGGQTYAGGLLWPNGQNVFFTLFIGLLSLCAFEYISEHAGEWKDRRGTHLLSWVLRLTGIVLPAIVLRIYAPTDVVELADPVWWLLAFAIPVVVYAVLLAGTRDVRKYQVWCSNIAVLSAAMLLADLMRTDYSALGVLTITMMYLFRKNHIKSMLAGCITLTVFNTFEISSLLCLLPVSAYNGKRGISMKYFFYAFYPVHLFLLYLISVFLV